MSCLYASNYLSDALKFLKLKPVEPALGALPAIDCSVGRGVSADLLMYQVWVDVYEKSKKTLQDVILFVPQSGLISLTPGTSTFLAMDDANVDFLGSLMARSKQGRTHTDESIAGIISKKFKVDKGYAADFVTMADQIASRGIRHLAFRASEPLRASFLKNLALIFNIQHVSAPNVSQYIRPGKFLLGDFPGVHALLPGHHFFGSGKEESLVLSKGPPMVSDIFGASEAAYKHLQKNYFSYKINPHVRFNDSIVVYGSCIDDKMGNVVFPKQKGYKDTLRVAHNGRFLAPAAVPVAATPPGPKKKLFRGRIIQAIKDKVDARRKN